MLKDQFLKMNDNLDIKLRETWIKKNADYSNGKDVLSNFIKSAHRFEEPVCMSLLREIDKKDIRLVELLSKNKSPGNESVKDSIEDMIIYLKLLYASLEEKQPETKEVKSITLDANLSPEDVIKHRDSNEKCECNFINELQHTEISNGLGSVKLICKVCDGIREVSNE